MTLLLSTARHARIHLVLAAQNPVKIHMVCGIANIPARMCFKVPDSHSSMAVIGRGGGHKLSGRGYMIFDTIDKHDVKLKGSFISESDAKKLLGELNGEFKQENQYPFKLSETTVVSATNEAQNPTKKSSPEDEFDENLAEVVVLLLKHGKISNAEIQDELEIGFKKANVYMDKLAAFGLVLPRDGKPKASELIPSSIADMATEAMEFLEQHGHTYEDIQAIFDSRN
jgi:S-DNA-T family DNA segregation ATPase FtsK/SpoIIIE